MRFVIALAAFAALLPSAFAQNNPCGGQCQTGYVCRETDLRWSCQCTVTEGSCSAAAPACGRTTAGVDNCGGICHREGAACPGPRAGVEDSQATSSQPNAPAGYTNTTAVKTAPLGGQPPSLESRGVNPFQRPVPRSNPLAALAAVLKQIARVMIAQGIAFIVAGIALFGSGSTVSNGRMLITLGVAILTAGLAILALANKLSS